MRLQAILHEVNNSNAAEMLGESWNDLSFTQKDQINLIERELKPIFDNMAYTMLFEKELTVDEIGTIFDNAVSKAEEGDNRTALGKAKDVATIPVNMAKALDKKINELGKTIQDSKPVAEFDTKFEKLKTDILTKNGDKKIVQMIQMLSEKAKKHSTLQVFVIGILTAAAAILMGPVGGAAAGFIFNAVSQLLQGEKLSTAVGTSAKSALYGLLAGMAFRWIGGEVINNIVNAVDADITAAEEAFKQAQSEAVKSAAIANNPDLAAFLKADNVTQFTYTGNINRFYFDYDLFLTPENSEKMNAMYDAIQSTESFSDEYYKATTKLHDFLSSVQNGPNQTGFRASFDLLDKMAEAGKSLSMDNLEKVVDMGNALEAKIEALSKADSFLSGIIQGSVQQAENAKKSMHKVDKPVIAPENKPTTESLEDNGQLLEENFFSKAVQAAKVAGKNITNIVTRDKLQKAWVKAGEPTDSKIIKKILNVFFDPTVSSELILPADPDIDVPTEEEKQVAKNKELDLLANDITFDEGTDEIIAYIKSKITAEPEPATA